MLLVYDVEEASLPTGNPDSIIFTLCTYVHKIYYSLMDSCVHDEHVR